MLWHQHPPTCDMGITVPSLPLQLSAHSTVAMVKWWKTCEGPRQMNRQLGESCTSHLAAERLTKVLGHLRRV